jgi:FAD/FMN-containing dehydrogenase
VLFGENYARLQKIKKEYDPDLVFYKWSPITPAA